MVLKESDLCREQFERTEAGFDKKNETLKGYREVIKDKVAEIARPSRELIKTVAAVGFVAALGVGCSTPEKESFSVAVNCPDGSSLDVRDTEVQGVASLVCYGDGLNSEGKLEKYSPISIVDLDSFSPDGIPDEYESRLDFEVAYTHQPGEEFLNNFTVNYDLQTDPVFENFQFSEIQGEDGVYMDVGRHAYVDIKVTELGQQ